MHGFGSRVSTNVSRRGWIPLVEAYSYVIRWSIREAQTSRLAPLVPSSGPAEHITQGPGVTIPIAQASLPSMRWCHCLCHAGVIALVALASAHLQCCLQHIILAKLVSLPVLLWHSCFNHWGWHHCWLALSPSLHWRPCPCAGATNRITLASLLLRWHYSPCCAGVCLIAI